MKGIFLMLLILFVLTTVGCGDGCNRARSNAGVSPCTELNFDGYEKTIPILNTHKQLFKENYALIDDMGGTVEMGASSVNLQEELTSAHIGDFQNAIEAHGEDIAGVKIYYGANSGATDIFLIYKPILLEKSANSTTTKWHYLVNEDLSSSYYRLISGNLVASPNYASIAFYLNSYSDHMNKRDGTAGAYEPVNIDYSITSTNTDPASIIYPIAEIDELILQNQAAIVSFNEYLANKGSELYQMYMLKSVIGVVFHNVQDASSKKHDLYIEPKFDNPHVNFTDPPDNIAVVIENYFKGNAANLGSLCPPNCPEVKYPCK